MSSHYINNTTHTLDHCSFSVGPMCEKCHQLLAVGRWFPPGTLVSSTRKLISSSFHRLDMTLAVAEALNPNTTIKKLFLFNRLEAATLPYSSLHTAALRWQCPALYAGGGVGWGVLGGTEVGQRPMLPNLFPLLIN